MSIRTTITLDDDVAARLKEESRLRGVPFRKLLNDVLRRGLQGAKTSRVQSPFKIAPVDLGTFTGMNYDNTSSLIEHAEGDVWR